jgi:nucleotide-binding universal stress UspA family protein
MRVLLAVDRSEYAEIVLEHGLDQAARSGVDELHFVTAVDTDREVAAARTWLEDAVGDLIETFRCTPTRVMLHVRRGRPAVAIAELVEEIRPDLLVIGRFHVPSESEAIADLVHCPTLVIGIEGHILDPQCPECERARRDSDGEVLFCSAHDDGRIPDLVTRLPPSYQLGSRLW